MVSDLSEQESEDVCVIRAERKDKLVVFLKISPSILSVVRTGLTKTRIIQNDSSVEFRGCAVLKPDGTRREWYEMYAKDFWPSQNMPLFNENGLTDFVGLLCGVEDGISLEFIRPVSVEVMEKSLRDFGETLRRLYKENVKPYKIEYVLRTSEV